MIDFNAIADQFPIRETLQRYGIKVSGSGQYVCPLHDDHPPGSGSLYTGKDGRERWKCHAASCGLQGDSLDFVQAIERCDRREAVEKLTGQAAPYPRPERKPPKLTVVPKFDLIPFPADHPFRPGVVTPPFLHKTGKLRSYTPSMVHPYHDAEGKVVLLALRIDIPGKKKLFVQVSNDRDKGYVAVGWENRQPAFYRQRQMLGVHRDRAVLVVEGEKCADALAHLPAFADYTVITWQGGAQVAAKQPWPLLKGRDVLFWPDNDDGGIKAMEKAAKLSQAARIRILKPPEHWAEKYDAWDLLHDLKGDAQEARSTMESLSVEWGGGDDGGGPGGPQEPPPPGPDGEPIRYSTNKDGDLSVSSHRNWWTYISQDPRFGHKLSFDVFDKLNLVDGMPMDDARVWELCEEMENGRPPWRGLTLDRLGPMLHTLSCKVPVNRLADELRKLPWDGVERHLLDYAGADPKSEWAAVAGHRWLLGLVKRIIEPGCQHDLVLVLEGEQGVGKTSFFRTMGQICGRNLYTGLSKLSQDKDIQMKLAGKAVVELAEMTAHRQGDNDVLKDMISATIDHYRLPYARRIEEVARTCVFGGSTNEQKYLKDMTGHRRYLIVEVTRPADIEGLKRDLPQILAEAVVALANGEPNKLSDAEEKIQRQVNKIREIEWPQFVALEEHLDAAPEPEYSREKLWTIAGIPPSQRNNPLNAALTHLMKERGWTFSSKTRRWRQRPKLDPVTD